MVSLLFILFTALAFLWLFAVFAINLRVEEGKFLSFPAAFIYAVLLVGIVITGRFSFVDIYKPIAGILCSLMGELALFYYLDAFIDKWNLALASIFFLFSIIESPVSFYVFILFTFIYFVIIIVNIINIPIHKDKINLLSLFYISLPFLYHLILIALFFGRYYSQLFHIIYFTFIGI